MTTITQSKLFPIYLINFIGSLGYSLVLPFLIVLVLDFGGNELIYGVLGATYSSFQLFGAPILGSWSDRVGRKRILLLTQLGTFLAWCIFLLALLIPNWPLAEINSTWLGSFMLGWPLLLLFVGRAFDGATGGNVSVANAYLADVSSPEDRKANFGNMSAAGSLGFVVGPALAGVLGATVLGNILPVLAAMLISAVAIIVILRLLPETKQCDDTPERTADFIERKVQGQEHKDCKPSPREETGHRFWDVWKLPYVPFFIIVYFLVFLAFNFFYVAFPVYAIEGLHWSTVELGIFYSALGGTMVFFQGPVLSRLSKWASDATLILTGSALLALGFCLFTIPNVWLVGLGVLLFSGGNGIMWPSFLSLLSRSVPAADQGAVQGYAGSAGSLASIIGLIIGGLLYTLLGSQLFFLPAIVLGAILFLGLQFIRIEQAAQRSVPST